VRVHNRFNGVVLALLLLSATAFGQQVNSDQLKLKTNGGLIGDASKSIVVAPYRGTSAPASPVTGQMWCDTNTTPCILKQYDGAAWNATTSVSVISSQADLSSFPASPSNGQLFYDQSHFMLWIWNSTASAWYATNGSGSHTGSAIVDNFTGTTITDPTLGSMTAADNATAGNLTVGAHSFKVGCENSTGGSTNPTAYTPSVTFTASHSFNLSSIPTCSGGPTTTRRQVYMSKAAQQTSGPWWWVYTIADNSTTSLTANVGLADANLVLLAPKNNYSAALNARWTVTNTTASTTTGGCGATGSSIACYSSNSTAGQWNATSDPTVRVALDVTSYNTGDYTIQYRIVNFGLTSSSADGTFTNPTLGGMRVGSADNTILVSMAAGCTSMAGNACYYGNAQSWGSWTSPLTVGNNFVATWATRRSTGANFDQQGYACSFNPQTAFAGQPFPIIDAVAWVKFVKKGTKLAGYVSGNGRDWMLVTLRSANGATGYWDATSANPTQFEVDIMQSGGGSAVRYYVEFDSFTLTVN
jgi:hypothetical protein